MNYIQKIISTIFLVFLCSCSNTVRIIPCEIFNDPYNFFHKEIVDRIPFKVNLSKVDNNFQLNCKDFIITNEEENKDQIIFNKLIFISDIEIHYEYYYGIENVRVEGILINEKGIWVSQKYDYKEN